MRISFLYRSILLFLVIVVPAFLRAQFQQPTNEELQMTADPKAQNASAVYLYHEVIDDGQNDTGSFYDRIKVLTEKGKELATVSIPYEYGTDKITNIEGRTIHADGTVIPLTAKPDDLMNIKTKGFQRNTLVFTLPSVEVGSILEYRVKLRRSESSYFLPLWRIQKPYFVHKAHYFFRPNSDVSLMYEARLGPDAKVIRSKKDDFTLDVVDVPPQPDEDWMPPLNTYLWNVEFYYARFVSDKDFWNSAESSWAFWVKNFVIPSGHLKNAVAEIVAPNDTDEQKAVKIYDTVLKLENTDFTRRKSEAERKKNKLKDINSAEDVWKRQSGTGDELTLLYVAMARAAGLKASPMEVVDRSRALFDNAYLSTRQLDDYIAIVELDGKDVYLDPGQKMCPFGLLHWNHTLASGLRLADKKAVFATTPPNTYMNSTISRIANLSIDEKGGVKGTVRFVMTGQEALHWRQLALENDEEEVKKQFNESMRDHFPDGVQGDFDHFLGIEDYRNNLIGTIQIKGSLGAATNKHFFLPGLFFESRAKHPFVALDKRIIPIDVHYPKIEQDDVTYDLPPGFNVETPQAVNVAWPDHALLKIDFQTTGSSIEVSRTLVYNYTVLDSKDYTGLHDFYQKVATADQQQLVLTRALSAKGN